MSSLIPRDIPELPAIPGMAVVMPSHVPPTAVSPPVRRPAVAVFRLLTALTAVAGIAAAMVAAFSERGPAQSPLQPLLQTLAHFTVQANLVLAAVTAVAATRSWRPTHPVQPALRAAALLYVLTATLIHQAFASTTHLSPRADDLLLHLVTPALAALDWLLLTPPGGLSLRRAATPLFFPLAYLAATLALTAITGGGSGSHRGTKAALPYPFLDVSAHGYLPTTGNALLIALSCYALSALLTALDSVRPDLTRLRPNTGFRLRPPVG